MILKFKLAGLILFAVLILAACGDRSEAGLTAPDENTPAGEVMPEGNSIATVLPPVNTEASPPGVSSNPPGDMESQTGETLPPVPTEEMDAPGEMADELPAYFSTVLINPGDGRQFFIADLKGKVILVENMAIWCSTCRRQQEEVKILLGQLGARDDFVSLGLDIDPNESLQDLKSYVEANGFNWLYAVAPPEMAREIDQLYGSQFLNPPSAPMFIIDRLGQFHPLPFGVKSAAELLAAIEPFLNGG